MFSFRWHPSRLVRASVALGLAIIGAVLVWAALPRPSSPDPTLATAPNGQRTPSMSAPVPEASAQRPTLQADQSDVRDRITGLVLPGSHPVAVAIPKLGVRSRLVDLGLEGNGAIEVPKDPADAGWFSGGPTPGALGPA